MKILRERTKADVIDLLDQSIFTRDAFDWSFNEDEVTISVKFRDREGFHFVLEDDLPPKSCTTS